MIKDADHPGWSSEETEAYFVERMADVSEEMMASIRMISDQLALLKIDQTVQDQTTSDSPAKELSPLTVSDDFPRDLVDSSSRPPRNSI